MQIYDYAHQVTNQPINPSTRLPLEAITAALFFVVPALLFFVLSVK